MLVGCGVVYVIVKASAALAQHLIDEEDGTFASPDFLLFEYAMLAIGIESAAVAVFFSKGKWRVWFRAASLLTLVPVVAWLVFRILPPPQQGHMFKQINLMCVSCWAVSFYVDSEFDEIYMKKEIQNLSKLKYKYKKV